MIVQLPFALDKQLVGGAGREGKVAQAHHNPDLSQDMIAGFVHVALRHLEVGFICPHGPLNARARQSG